MAAETQTAKDSGEGLDLRNLIETIPALVLCALPDGSIEFANRAWQEYTGDAVDQLGWQKTIHPDDAPAFINEWDASFQTGRPFSVEARVRGADGRYRWFLIRKALAVTPTRNNKPSLRTLIACEDITERKREETARGYIEESYRLIVETASDAVVTMDETGAIRFANPSTMKIFGYAPTELIGKPLTVLMPEFMRKLHETGFRRYLATGQRHMNWQGTELIALRKNGEEFSVEVSFGELTRDGHKLFTGFLRDISEKKKTEEALRRSEAYLAQAQRIAHVGSWVWQVAGRKAVYLSEEWYRVYGFDPKDGIPTWEERLQRVHPEDRAVFQAAIDLAIAQKSDYDVEFRISSPHAAVRYVHSVGRSVLDSSGELVQFTGVSMDVTESKRAEEEHERLRQARADLVHINRVSTMGEVTASLAHEIKQPIGAAVTNAEACARLLDHDQPDIPEAREAALEMAKDARRAAHIIDHVRSLYRKGSSQMEAVEVNEVIREMLLMLRSEANRNSVSIRTDLADGLPQVTADHVQLQQVLMNLMLNGIQAMEKTGGALTVKSQLDQDGRVLVSVSDTGVGLPPDKADQIFNAFFTTKTEGSGMGLAISRSIIESHGGRVWATANFGKGATFHFTLPIRTQAPSRDPLSLAPRRGDTD